MRIISKFHDFYDVGQRYMFDPAIIYFRDTEEIPNKEIPSCCKTYDVDGKFLFEIIGFCGKIIPVISMKGKVEKDGFYDRQYVYSIDQIDESIEDCQKEMKSWIEDKVFIDKRWFGQSNSIDVANLEKLFMTFRTPIFHIQYSYRTDSRLIINPCLKELKFFRFLDSITTFQEIFNFVSNDLVNVDGGKIDIPNDVMAASKGFGHKYAFRKEPEC